MLNVRPFNAVREVQENADDWFVDNNEFRPHESLGNLPPVIYRDGLFNQNLSNPKLFP